MIAFFTHRNRSHKPIGSLMKLKLKINDGRILHLGKTGAHTIQILPLRTAAFPIQRIGHRIQQHRLSASCLPLYEKQMLFVKYMKIDALLFYIRTKGLQLQYFRSHTFPLSPAFAVPVKTAASLLHSALPHNNPERTAVQYPNRISSPNPVIVS